MTTPSVRRNAALIEKKSLSVARPVRGEVGFEVIDMKKIKILIHGQAKAIHSVPRFLRVPKDWFMLIFGGFLRTMNDVPGTTEWKEISIATRKNLYAFVVNKKYRKLYETNTEQDDLLSINYQFYAYKEMCYTLTDYEVNNFKHYNIAIPAELYNYVPVTIITPTYNRKHLFPIALFNYHNFNYPQKLIEWIVVDDSDDPEKTINHYPNYIKVIKLNKKYTVGAKRNMGVEQAKNNIIMMMDDDDLYYPNSVSYRVCCLLGIKNKVACCGCTFIMNYHFRNGKFTFSSDGIKVFSEATLVFTKDYWKERQFHGEVQKGEGVAFVMGRDKYLTSMNYQNVFIALNHSYNMTLDRQKYSDEIGQNVKEEEIFTKNQLEFIKEMKSIALSP